MTEEQKRNLRVLRRMANSERKLTKIAEKMANTGIAYMEKKYG